MKIIILGKNGQVGWELQRALQPLGEVTSFSRDFRNGVSGDITNFNEIRKLFELENPNIIVNATAYTAVDKAEQEPEKCDLVNHLAVSNLGQLCKQYSCLLVHFSTDYVFDGSGSKPWSETDATNPINQYGMTKRDGELALESSGCKFINFRTSWVYGLKGNNFIKTMLKLAKTKNELGIVSDQIGAPTGAALIADVTAQVIRYYSLQPENIKDKLVGHYHLAASGETSWYDYANFIFKTATNTGYQLAIKDVKPMLTEKYPTPAKRPHNSRLETTKLKKTFKLYMPHWKLGVAQVIQELNNDQ